MTATTLTLDDFLLARFAEDEAVARSAGDGGPVVNGRRSELVQEWDRDYGPVVGSISIDSGRVLAECEAKRRIVESSRWVVNQERVPTDRPGVYDKVDVYAVDEDREDVLRLLALPYADHPDCDEAWRV